MGIRTFLLAAGVALAAASPALALEEGDALEYVRVCDAFGTGFFYIPGTETCLKIGGYVRFDANLSATNNSFGIDGSDTERWDFRTEYGIHFDTRTSTEYGILRSFASFWGDTTDHVPGTDLPFLRADKAFIQFAGFTFGYRQSLFDFGGGYTDDPGLIGDEKTSSIKYTWDLGNSLKISAALEDPYPRWGSYSPEGALPDVVLRISDRFDWGKFKAALGFADLDDGLAWGAKIGTDIKLETFGLPDGSKLRLAFGYARDGGDWLGGGGVSKGDWWSGLISTKFVINPIYKWNVVSTLSYINGPGHSDDEWKASIGTFWRPVQGLRVGFEADFSAETGTHFLDYSSDRTETRLLFTAIRKWGGMSRMDNY